MDPSKLPPGAYDVDYHYGRRSKLQLTYRLRRRTDEVLAAIDRHGDGVPPRRIVDLGTADGMMLDRVQRETGCKFALGLDLSLPLLARSSPGVNCCLADATTSPLPDSCADVVISTAVIEHVDDPAALMNESRRLLRPGGLLVITTPDPMMERIANWVGLLKETGHQTTLNLRQLEKLASETELSAVESRKFMFSPIGFPMEKQIEKVFGPLGLRLFMANQIFVARKASGSPKG